MTNPVDEAVAAPHIRSRKMNSLKPVRNRHWKWKSFLSEHEGKWLSLEDIRKLYDVTRDNLRTVAWRHGFEIFDSECAKWVLFIKKDNHELLSKLERHSPRLKRRRLSM